MRKALVAVCLLAAACGAGQTEEARPVPVKTTWSAYGSQTPVVDHGGAVLPASKTWAIFWGPSSDFPSDLVPGMKALLSGFDGSNYLATADQYLRGASASTHYAGAVFDASAPPDPGTKWNDPRIADEVCKFFPTPDADAIYFIFTSNFPSNVNFCAWHASASCNGVTFQLAYLPNPPKGSFCFWDQSKDLGCNLARSQATSSIGDSVAHEFMEAVTDPHTDAWYDKDRSEIGDKCSFDYRSCVNLPTGSWQLQTEWSNAANGCVQGN